MLSSIPLISLPPAPQILTHLLECPIHPSHLNASMVWTVGCHVWAWPILPTSWLPLPHSHLSPVHSASCPHCSTEIAKVTITGCLPCGQIQEAPFSFSTLWHVVSVCLCETRSYLLLCSCITLFPGFLLTPLFQPGFNHGLLFLHRSPQGS